jgi:hypothetical protein
MAFDGDTRRSILRAQARGYVDTAIANAVREYPHMPYFVATGANDYRTHRELHPAFFGSFDWHSCVEMHWVIVRLLRRFPDDVPQEAARELLDRLLTPEHLAAEAAFFARPEHGSLERPYGWGWLLQLQGDLLEWDDADARRWATAVEPLAALLADRFVEWLPKLTYPQRTGMHPNTAFGLSRSVDYADVVAIRDDRPALRAAIAEASRRFFEADEDYPARWEPSGADFLSPALCEAELMSRVLPAAAFPGWLDHFLPGLAAREPTSLFRPAFVSDIADGQIAHLAGLNLSRAWAFVALASRLPAGDPRVGLLDAAAEEHAAASLPAVTGSDYMAEHWLAAYATLLLD